MKVEITQDGSSTIISEKFPNQHYHSTRGAIGEAMHVYVKFITQGMRILEIGFGSGLNAILCLNSKLNIKYTTIELYPVDIQTIKKLSFYSPTLEKLHSTHWETWVQISPNFSFRKLKFDIEKLNHQQHSLPIETTEKFDTVFFDAFAPDIVPKQWSVQVFTHLYSLIQDGGCLLTYSAKGEVKRALKTAGFAIKRLPGALGKHNMIQALKNTKKEWNEDWT